MSTRQICKIIGSQESRTEIDNCRYMSGDMTRQTIQKLESVVVFSKTSLVSGMLIALAETQRKISPSNGENKEMAITRCTFSFEIFFEKRSILLFYMAQSYWCNIKYLDPMRIPNCSRMWIHKKK